jgi:hypothetical protein
MQPNISPHNQAKKNNNCKDDCDIRDLIEMLHFTSFFVRSELCHGR